MAILKCKICGGDLFIQPNSSVAICDYCGTQQTIPAMDDDKKLNAYARANRLRQGFEFDKASALYENIISAYPREAEAYWGLVLCKYGISYVDDPKSGAKVPVINRMSYDSIADNDDWKKTYQYASEDAREVYYKEANYIEYIRRGAIEISSKEKPYDIFICYKATDGSGNRTEESVIAQEYYDYLSENGYKVFFAEITLEEKIGKEFEPIIFAALNSAKVMLVFGTCYDNYNAPWVKNEWMRFLNIMQTDREKVLIPCYKGIDPYDMPSEFVNLQAQNLNKLGAKQDILRGIGKIIPLKQENVGVTGGVDTKSQLHSLFTRLKLNLENDDFESVNAIANQILNLSPKNTHAYRALVLCEYKIKDIGELEGIKEDFRKSKNYKLYYKIDIASQDRLKGIEKRWIEQNKKRSKKRKRIVVFTLAAGLIVISIVLSMLVNKMVNNQLLIATNLAQEDKYDEALNAIMFKRIAEKKDPNLFNYISAGKLLEQGDYIGARRFYEELDDNYSDEIRKGGTLEEAIKIEELLSEKKYEDALKIANDSHKNKKVGFEELYFKIISQLIEEKNNLGYSLIQLCSIQKKGIDCKKEIKQVIEELDKQLSSMYRREEYWVIINSHNAVRRCNIETGDRFDLYCVMSALKEGDINITTFDIDYAVNILKQNINAEDAANLLLIDHLVAKKFLAGTWTSGNYYFSMDGEGHTTYNVPWFEYGDHYEIDEGTYWLYRYGELASNGKKLYDIKVLSENSISMYAYQNGQTYTLTRQ